ncbi:MAG: hypothetical protein GY908_10910 [Flavobacteriales bacterium]|nr:hypothetical protein [Flavobacteriales bacterium]
MGQITLSSVCIGLLTLGFTSITDVDQNIELQNESQVEGEIIWHVKAIHPKGSFLDVKALDPEGRKYNVKAIQDADQTTLLDIKVLMKRKTIPVKILQSDGRFMPVKAISSEGELNDVKGVKMLKEDVELEISGVKIYAHIKAVPQ